MEEKTIRELLEEQIATEIRALAELEAGSEEKTAAVEDLTKLYRLKIDENKSEWEADDKYHRRKLDKAASKRDDEIKRKQIAEDVKDRYFRVGTAAVELIVPLVFYGIWMKRGFVFEETGAYSSKTFNESRSLTSRFIGKFIGK